MMVDGGSWSRNTIFPVCNCPIAFPKKLLGKCTRVEPVKTGAVLGKKGTQPSPYIAMHQHNSCPYTYLTDRVIFIKYMAKTIEVVKLEHIMKITKMISSDVSKLPFCGLLRPFYVEQ